MRSFWCTSGINRIVPLVNTTDDVLGKTLHDVLPKRAADEREIVYRKVISTEQVQTHFQFSDDTRVICTIYPLDEQAFGHKGILGLIKDAPADVHLHLEYDLPLLSTPNLTELRILTFRELEVLHYVAKGMSTGEIAKRLSKSPKTIENQINSTHTKLGTHSRAQLVRYACERGIQSFSDHEWLSIINSYRVIHREQAAVHTKVTLKRSPSARS